VKVKIVSVSVEGRQVVGEENMGAKERDPRGVPSQRRGGIQTRGRGRKHQEREQQKHGGKRRKGR
jgi:hypothetical protein